MISLAKKTSFYRTVCLELSTGQARDPDISIGRFRKSLKDMDVLKLLAYSAHQSCFNVMGYINLRFRLYYNVHQIQPGYRSLNMHAESVV